MAGATREETFNVSAEKYYAAVTDYQNYKKILPEVDAINVKSVTDSSAEVEYTVSVVKSFKYTLKMQQKRPELLSWELSEGSLFKKNSGYWKIAALGPNQCQVTYNCEVELKIFAPKAVTNALVAVNLPRMMQSFYEHALTK